MGREGEDDDEAIDEKAPASYLSIAAEARLKLSIIRESHESFKTNR